MKVSTQRIVMRWLHIIASIPMFGYIYGPLAERPVAAFAVKFVLVPLVTLSGIWMWKGHLMRKWLAERKPAN